MSIRKTLLAHHHRFFNIGKVSGGAAALSPLQKVRRSSDDDRRFLHRPPVFQAERRVSFRVIEQIRNMRQEQVLLSLEGLAPPPMMMIEEARKVLRASQMEAARARLRLIQTNCVSYSEFAQICTEASGGDNGGSGIARALDDSGNVIVLGDLVFLRPDLIVGALQNMMSSSKVYQNDPRRMELKEMEHTKAEIDRKAEALVKKELWCGLGFLVLQTMGFMRLTFWELTWDVMEPICFFVTSIYFMAGYTFFLRTSRDPSFEGFFESRFVAKQRRLMKTHKFDVNKFNELRRAYGFPSPPPLKQSTSTYCDCRRRSTLLGVDH